MKSNLEDIFLPLLASCQELISAENQKNASKLQLILNMSVELQFNIFHEYFPKDPEKLNEELKKDKKKVKRLRYEKEINPRQYFMIFPQNSNETHSSKFDSSLLHILLSNFCNFIKPKRGWKAIPEDTDGSKEANLVRLNVGRN